eukprot:evm.model.scf_835.2 EVM.evm.TU.scf_835.2   scf_835:4670-6480(-)
MLVQPPVAADCPDVIAAVTADPSVGAAVDAFLSGPQVVVDSSRRCIHVAQGEFCCTDLRAGTAGLWLGSSEATTCVIAVAICRSSELASVGHFDDSCKRSSEGIKAWIRGMRRPRVYLVGAYQDADGESACVAAAILSYLHGAQDIEAEILLACVSRRNTGADGWPIASSLAVDCQSGTAMRCTFEDKGPWQVESRARFWVQSCNRMTELVYDHLAGTLTVPGYCAAVDFWRLAKFERWLSLPDAQLIRIVSTSPDHEDTDFIPGVRQVLQWVIQHQEDQSIVPEQIFYWTPGKGWTPPQGSNNPLATSHIAKHQLSPSQA